MSDSPAPENVILDCFNEALQNVSRPGTPDAISNFIIQLIQKCDAIGRSKFHLRVNQIGRCRGDWFEYGMKEALTVFLSAGEVTVYPGRGHSIEEFVGFQGVTWIPMPDAIVKDPNDLRAVLSFKWGMRHDRMYEVGYEAYAVKDWISRKKLRPVQVLLVTNDNFSGWESRLRTMHACPVIDGIYYVNYGNLRPELRAFTRSMSQLVANIRQLAA